jgi:hypothetical protein
VLFPSWFIEPTAVSKQSDVWVLNSKALPSFIANSQKCLSGDDLSLVTYHLSRFIRTAVEVMNVASADGVGYLIRTSNPYFRQYL